MRCPSIASFSTISNLENSIEFLEILFIHSVAMLWKFNWHVHQFI